MSTTWKHPLMEGLPVLGKEIEQLSHVMIQDALKMEDDGSCEFAIRRRMIHAVGDVNIYDSIHISKNAIAKGLEALKKKAPIFCDVRMLTAGITRTESTVSCGISDPEVIAYSKENGTTRAYAQMMVWGEKLNDAIVCIGNAPTAIWALLELNATKGIRPALVVGTPVGFVGAAESKQALYESDLDFITILGNKGGSPMAASATNAVCIYAKNNN